MSNRSHLPGQAIQVIDTRYTQDVIPILDTSKFEHMQRIATVMSECGYVPDHLRKGETPSARMATCFLIVNQAVRWGMDPFALAQTVFQVSGKLGFEGKAIAAVINSDPRLKGRLNYEFSGEGAGRKITVIGTFRDTGETKTIEGLLSKWKTNNKQWTEDPDQMLVYRGSRQWARRWMPDRLLGVYSADELEDIALRDIPTGQRAARMKDITPVPAVPEIAPPIPEISAIPDIDQTPKTDAAAYLAQLEDALAVAKGQPELIAEIVDEHEAHVADLDEDTQAKAEDLIKAAE
jgi:hypothetical protein